jgi:hypothetical protein
VLGELLQALLLITGDRELVMVGSQSVHASTSDVPIEVVMGVQRHRGSHGGFTATPWR